LQLVIVECAISLWNLIHRIAMQCKAKEMAAKYRKQMKIQQGKGPAIIPPVEELPLVTDEDL
jgi:hypothetical protein